MRQIREMDTTTATTASEWRAQVGRAKQLCDDLDLSSSNLAALQQVARDVAAVQNRIAAKEDLLNTKHSDTLKQLQEAKDRVAALQTQKSELTSSVQSRKEQLAETTQKLNETKKAIKAKGKSMTDMSPLVQIKATIQSTRAEIEDFDIRVGVLSHFLLHSQLRNDDDVDEDDEEFSVDSEHDDHIIVGHDG